MAIRVVLAEDNTLLREGMARLLDRADDIQLLGMAADLPELLALIADARRRHGTAGLWWMRMSARCSPSTRCPS